MTDKFFTTEQGDMESAKEKAPQVGKTPKTGFDSAPRGRQMEFEQTYSIGGTNPGAS